MSRDYGDDQIRASDDASNPWSQYRRVIIRRLEELDEDTEKLTVNLEVLKKESNKSIDDFKAEVRLALKEMSTDVTTLKVRSAIIGAISGTVFAGIVSGVIKLIFK